MGDSIALLDPTSTVNGTGPDFEYPEPAYNSPYRVLKQYHYRLQKLRVACAGAGASGLCLAYKMQKLLVPRSWELNGYEKKDSIGGTWYENTHPGVACDIPAHVYTFSFDPNPEWSRYYAGGGEIQEYFKGFAERHGCQRYVTLGTRDVRAAWDESQVKWNLTLENQHTKEQRQDWAHCFVNVTGKIFTES